MNLFCFSLCLIVSIVSVQLDKNSWDLWHNAVKGVGSVGNSVYKEVAPVAKGEVKKATVVANVVVKESDKAVAVVGSTAIKAGKGVLKETVNAAAETAKFSAEVVSEIENAAKEVAHEIGKVIDIIKAALNGLDCSINENDLFKIAKAVASTSTNFYTTLKDAGNYKNLAGGIPYIEEAACRIVWDRLTQVAPMITLVTEFLKLLSDKCPAVSSFLGDANPAISLGVGVAVSVDSGLSMEVAAEIGLAIDSRGGKYCYIGGCISQGVVLPPIPSGGVDTGVHLSIWTSPDSIPGTSSILGMAGNFGAFGLEISTSLTYIYGDGDISKFLGLSASGTVGVITEAVTVSVGFSAGQCNTPVFVKYKPFRYSGIFGNWLQETSNVTTSPPRRSHPLQKR